MARNVSVGNQEFDNIREHDTFYIDKTQFIENWWNRNDKVTLVTRPRRFGKTLMMSTVNCFFSNRYKDRKDLFDGLCISTKPGMMELQGTLPVVFLSFSDCKNSEDAKYINAYKDMVDTIKEEISQLYNQFPELLESDRITQAQKDRFSSIRDNDSSVLTIRAMTGSVQFLCMLLCSHYGVKPLVILDEYDTPLQEAYASGYWEQLVKTMRSLFNKTFKTTKYFERALLTGITRVSKASLFSDVNNFKTVPVTSSLYADCFGFTEEEVFNALEEYGMGDKKNKVKAWYDGFVFGKAREIYNPYAIASFLDEGRFLTYWADTSDNALVSQLLRRGTGELRNGFLHLMKGERIDCEINENVVFPDLDHDEKAVWSLLLASGYLKAVECLQDEDGDEEESLRYALEITNKETRVMFKKLVAR